MRPTAIASHTIDSVRQSSVWCGGRAAPGGDFFDVRFKGFERWPARDNGLNNELNEHNTLLVRTSNMK